MTSLAFVSLLLVAVMLPSASANGGISDCCRHISSTMVHRDSLRTYHIQDRPLCPIHAVVFTTLKGKRICSNPNKLWTKTSMAYLDGKQWQRQHAIRQ